MPRRPAPPPVCQLDIFEDGRPAMLRNDLVAAVERRDLPAARSAWQALADDCPQDEALSPLALLIGALDAASSTDDFSDDAAGRERLRAAGFRLEGTVRPAARRWFGDAAAAVWLQPMWRSLARRAQALRWRADAATGTGTDAIDRVDHAAPLWLRAADWQAAAAAVAGIESWRRIPAPLAWMAEATLRRHGLDESWPLLVELAWLSAARLRALAGRVDDPLLTRLLASFDNGFDADRGPAGDGSDSLAWFPAWLLTERPALAPRLAQAQPSRRTAPEQAMRLLVELLGFERQGRQADVIAGRRRLRDGHAGLYAAYLRTR